MKKRKNPAPREMGNGADILLCNAKKSTPNFIQFQDVRSIAAARLVRRFGLTHPVARAICHANQWGANHV